MPASPEEFLNAQDTEYSVTRTTLHFPGLEQVGAAGPVGTPCLFIRVHAPYEQEVVQWSAKRLAGPPVVPSPVDPASPLGYSPNLILLDFKFSIPILMPMGGGNPGHIWLVSGYALYGKKIVEGPICNYRTGVMPWEQNTKNPSQWDYPNYFPADKFQMGIIDPRPASSTLTFDNPIQDPTPPTGP